jgi:protein O-mannosyl-transferase
MISSSDSESSSFSVLTLQRFNAATLASIVSVALAAITLLSYWPITSHQFICLDDQHYLFDSPHVRNGVTWQGIVWAFQTGYFSNWHPLTWISFMLDSQIFGMKPAGFLLTNLVLHTANCLLLFVWLKAITRKIWPSALVAALFAWHPLHVESVAWVSERKDVLSTLFFLLTLIAYSSYAKLSSNRNESDVSHKTERGKHHHYLSLLFFMFGLMSKPMVVTLPFVLLLLDYWPLRRFDLFKLDSLRVDLPRLTLEKLLYFILAFAASVVTVVVQRAGGAVSSLGGVSLFRRLANSLIAYFDYVSNTLWPVNLSAVYPMPLDLSIGTAIVAGIVLVFISALVLKGAKSFPFAVTGWLWFLGTLVPVIGLVQVGAQAMADRYMYIPSIGLFILLAWGLQELVLSLAKRRIAFVAATVAALGVCLVCTRIQLGYWQNSETLFRHALAVMPNNYLAYDNLGKALQDQGRSDEAIASWTKAVQLAPGYSEAQYNLGTALLEQGRHAESIVHLQAAVKAAPGDANAHQNLANAYLKLGELAQATAEYAESATLAPDVPVFRRVLGSALLRQSKWNDAALVLSDAVRLEPGNAEANRNLGVALINQGRGGEALKYFEEAARLEPNNTDMRFNFGLALLDQNQPARAAEQFSECLRLNPDETRSHYRLAVALSQQHKLKEAISHYNEALRLSPEFPEALNGLARLLACAPEDALRDGPEAVKLAEKACAMTKNQRPEMLTTLAAAYAEAGKFQDAIGIGQKARELATSNGQTALAAKAGELVQLWQSGRPLRE